MKHAAAPDPRLVRLLRAAAVFIGCGVLLYVGFVLWSGAGAVGAAFRRLGGALLAGGTVLASAAYLVRYLRWRTMLAGLGLAPPERPHLCAYLAGLTLTSSPGKLGETVRSALLLPFGVPVSASVAAFVADRLSDVIGVALLGLVAGFLAGRPNGLLALLLAAGLAAGLVAGALARSPRALRTLRRLGRRHRLLSGSLWHAARAWRGIWLAPRVPLYALAAMIAYGIQALVFALYVRQLAPELGFARLVEVFCTATLIGAASLLPGGIGVMEGSMVVLLVQAGMDTAAALSATIATRLSTLWCGMLIGVAALTVLMRRFDTLRPVAPHPSTTDS